MPTLAISYLNSKAKLNDLVYLGVSVDTQGQEIVGADVILNVSSYLQILRYIPSSLLIPNYFDVLGSVLRFSQVTDIAGANFIGSGQIATIECRAIKKGTAAVNFKFTLGSTTDTNLASKDAKDLLTAVTNRKIKII